MIHFLINNDYHHVDFTLHAKQFNRSRIKLIEIVHTLERRDNSALAAATERFEPVNRRGFARSVWSHCRLVPIIRERIRPRPEDVLFVYTEWELLNQVVVNLFRAAGARVYLIEDGGVGTYIPFRTTSSEPLTLRERVIACIQASLPGVRSLRQRKLSGIVYPWMPDTAFDGVCFYQDVSIARQIPVITVQRPPEPHVEGDGRTALFLNQDLYAFGYQTEAEYLETLDTIVGALAKRFSQVSFAFHPRESEAWRAIIHERVLSGFPNVSVLPNRGGIEASVAAVRPAVVASFNSTGLMNLFYRGIQPLYLFHLFPTLTRHPDFAENQRILEEMGYRFVPSLEAVAADYVSGLRQGASAAHARTLADLVPT